MQRRGSNALAVDVFFTLYSPYPTVIRLHSEDKAGENGLMGQNSPKTLENGCFEMLKTPAGTEALAPLGRLKFPCGTMTKFPAGVFLASKGQKKISRTNLKKYARYGAFFKY